MANRESSPIIILQADHGPVHAWTSPTTDEYRIRRFRILNAYYPAMDGLYESITPVNTFRLIFNEYFGGNYEMLDDVNYMLTGGKSYEFFDVTETVKYK